MAVELALRRRFTLRTMAGGALLASEVIECADDASAIELARTRAVEVVPGVSVEVWIRQAMLWSSRVSALLGIALLDA